VSPDLDVSPRENEVAAVYLPAGARVTLDGAPVPDPGREYARYMVLGWDKISGGARTCTYGGWQGMRNGQDRDSRPVWDDAATFLRVAEREGRGPAVLYVVIEDRPRYGRSRLTAVRVRQPG
jgi:hypothetical protein